MSVDDSTSKLIQYCLDHSTAPNGGPLRPGARNIPQNPGAANAIRSFTRATATDDQQDATA